MTTANPSSALPAARLSTQLPRPSPKAEGGGCTSPVAVLLLLLVMMSHDLHPALPACQARGPGRGGLVPSPSEMRKQRWQQAGGQGWIPSQAVSQPPLCCTLNHHAQLPQELCLRETRGGLDRRPVLRTRGRHTLAGVISASSLFRDHKMGQGRQSETKINILHSDSANQLRTR